MPQVALTTAFALIPTLLGTLTTYLYEESLPLSWRVAAGACTGFASLGLLGFAAAFALRLDVALMLVAIVALALIGVLISIPLIRNPVWRDTGDAWNRLRNTAVHPTRGSILYAILIGGLVMLSMAALDRVLFVRDDGLHTGVMTNFGDLPFHLGVIARFAQGTNIPPESPIFAGVPFTYPFLADFITALPVAAGANVRHVMLAQNLVLLLAFGVLLHRWALQLTNDRLAAFFSGVLVFASGGLGWWMLVGDAPNGGGIIATLGHLPHDYTVLNRTTWRWGNVVTALLIPQRSFLLGLPIALVVLTLLQREIGAVDQQMPLGTRRFVAAGVIAGLLPLVHAHSLMVVCGVAAYLAVMQGPWRKWLPFFAFVAVVGSPQVLWSARGTAMSTSSFIGWQFGWDHGTDNIAWFWIKNTGLLIPLVVTAFVWRSSRDRITRGAVLLYVPFVLWFVIANLVRMAPWIWDNIKVLVYWFIASAPFAALVLAQLWRRGRLSRVLAVLMLASLTLAGALDLWRVVSRAADARVFDSEGIAFAHYIEERTSPRALILHAPVQNHPVFLTGRRSFMGFPGHVWSHGLPSAAREQEIKEMYAGSPQGRELLARNAIDYVVIGPLERRLLHPNVEFFAQHFEAEQSGDFAVYRITSDAH